MRGQGVLVGWLLVAVVLVLGVVYELNEWRTVAGRRSQVANEHRRLSAQLSALDEELRREERVHSDLLRDLQWSSDGGDPSAFLNGLAEFAQGSRLKITGIGPLERQAVTQFNKSWHTIQVIGPFRDVKDLTTRIEREGGILEDVVLQTQSAASGAPQSGADEVQAVMKLTTVELTQQSKDILRRVGAAQGGRSGRASSLALPVPSSDGAVRDPFTFAVAALPARPPRVAASSTGRPAPEPSSPAADTPPNTSPPPPAPPAAPVVPLDVKGIVQFPGGNLAIVNNQIVQVGDVVEGHRVEQISDTTVVVRADDGAPRTLTLPSITAPAPSAARR
jgi:hypothetical protein